MSKEVHERVATMTLYNAFGITRDHDEAFK